ncbi:hypothetical protein D1816_01865 [Aquimarina sp. AD10]|uniref:hypothetical protein n=1 Tax=Aquimarina TaxID=290174 RepID=UPI000E4C926B|nr:MULTISPECIES: hypothetical protein [Aquimarina]AXT59146.1 hypothetical protein D1816_01865 [Aquimarina sp. AD10]RKM93853.1 hypothetical protein D7033_18890 [Aquimarina sp. AD10]
MKKILALKGVEVLSKKQKQQIKGAIGIGCCPSGRGCLISFPGGSFCEPGRCLPYGGCIFY